jgi:hypothetical protein
MVCSMYGAIHRSNKSKGPHFRFLELVGFISVSKRGLLFYRSKSLFALFSVVSGT